MPDAEDGDPTGLRRKVGSEAITRQTVASDAHEGALVAEINDMGVASCAVVAVTGLAICSIGSATRAPTVTTTPRTSVAALTASGSYGAIT